MLSVVVSSVPATIQQLCVKTTQHKLDVWQDAFRDETLQGKLTRLSWSILCEADKQSIIHNLHHPVQI
jgi:hypothetical protein